MKIAKKTPYVAKKPDANGYVAYTDEENLTWHDLIERQLTIVKERACDEYLLGLQRLDLTHTHIPQCKEISEKLMDATGWSVSPVEAIIPATQFFTLLANRHFPAATFIRRRKEFDYLEEPDIFHEFFGHCPMLTDHIYANFMQKYGEMSLQANEKDREMLARLYWFTVEFGLIKTHKGIRCYGGGILSSKEETVYAIDSDIPQRKRWDTLNALRTPYRIDIKQPIYYVLDNFEQLYHLLDHTVFNIIHQAYKLGEFKPCFKLEDS